MTEREAEMLRAVVWEVALLHALPVNLKGFGYPYSPRELRDLRDLVTHAVAEARTEVR